MNRRKKEKVEDQQDCLLNTENKVKINRLRRSPKPTKAQTRPEDTSTTSSKPDFKTPTRPPKGRFRSSVTEESPNNDSELQHDIIWDTNSPATPNRNGRGRRKATYAKLVDISEIVSRIAPKSRRPEEAESSLLQWIGDSAIPCTPEVPEPRTKPKSQRPNAVGDLLELAKRFDYKMIQQDGAHLQARHQSSEEAMDEDLELFSDDSHPVTPPQSEAERDLESASANADDSMGDLALVNEMVDDLDLLFDGATQQISGALSQGWSQVWSQEGPKHTQTKAGGAGTAYPVTPYSSENDNKHQSFSVEVGGALKSSVARMPVAMATLGNADFDDDWSNDDLLEDSLVLEMTQNPELFSGPQHSSTQKKQAGGFCRNAHASQKASSEVKYGGSQGPDQKLKRQTFQLDQQWSKTSGGLKSLKPETPAKNSQPRQDLASSKVYKAPDHPQVQKPSGTTTWSVKNSTFSSSFGSPGKSTQQRQDLPPNKAPVLVNKAHDQPQVQKPSGTTSWSVQTGAKNLSNFGSPGRSTQPRQDLPSSKAPLMVSKAHNQLQVQKPSGTTTWSVQTGVKNSLVSSSFGSPAKFTQQRQDQASSKAPVLVNKAHDQPQVQKPSGTTSWSVKNSTFSSSFGSPAKSTQQKQDPPSSKAPVLVPVSGNTNQWQYNTSNVQKPSGTTTWTNQNGTKTSMVSCSFGSPADSNHSKAPHDQQQVPKPSGTTTWSLQNSSFSSSFGSLGKSNQQRQNPSSSKAPVSANTNQWHNNTSNVQKPSETSTWTNRNGTKTSMVHSSVGSSSFQIVKKPKQPEDQGFNDFADDDLDSIFASDDIWDDDADDDDLFCEACENVDESDPKLVTKKATTENSSVQMRTKNNISKQENIHMKPHPPNNSIASKYNSFNASQLLAQSPAPLTTRSNPIENTLNNSITSSGTSSKVPYKFTQIKNISHQQISKTEAFNQSAFRVPDDHHFKKPFHATPALAKDVAQPVMMMKCTDAEIERKRLQAMERRRLRATANQNFRAPI